MPNKEIALAKLTQGVLDPLKPGRIVGPDFELEMGLGQTAEYLLTSATKFSRAFASFYGAKKFVWKPFARIAPYQKTGFQFSPRYSFGVKITRPGTDFCVVYMAPYPVWLERNLSLVARRASDDYRTYRLSHAQ